MEKPVSIQVFEFKQKLIGVIRSSELPAWAVRPILADILTAVSREEEMQYKADLVRWTEEQKKKPEGGDE